MGSIIIIILLCISLYYVGKYQLSYHLDDNMKGYGERKETVQVLLDRIEWSSNHYNRINYSIRYLLYSLIISFMANIVYVDKDVNYMDILKSTLVVWVILICSQSFFNFHADQFSGNFIRKNVKHIRKKMGLGTDIPNLKISNKRFKKIIDTL